MSCCVQEEIWCSKPTPPRPRQTVSDKPLLDDLPVFVAPKNAEMLSILALLQATPIKQAILRKSLKGQRRGTFRVWFLCHCVRAVCLNNPPLLRVSEVEWALLGCAIRVHIGWHFAPQVVFCLSGALSQTKYRYCAALCENGSFEQFRFWTDPPVATAHALHFSTQS